MKFRALLLLLALSLAPAPLAAQRGDRGIESRGPVEMLLRQRDALRLTPEQVGRLETIRRRMEERNRPLVARLVRIRREIPEELRRPPRRLTGEQRRELRRHTRQAEPILEEIRDNNRAAMREVGEVLTREQKGRIREMLRDRRRDGDRGERSRRGHGPGR